MKKFTILLIAVMIGLGSFANSPRDIDKKVVQTFKLLFPNAKEVNWYERPGTYEVYFVEGGIKTRMTYWKDGFVVQFIRYYEEKYLPAYVQYRIKKEYPGKTIWGVTELSTITGPDEIVKVEYNIKLVDEKNLLSVRLDSDGFLKVMEKFKKAF